MMVVDTSDMIVSLSEVASEFGVEAGHLFTVCFLLDNGIEDWQKAHEWKTLRHEVQQSVREANTVKSHPHVKVAGLVLTVELYGLISTHDSAAVFTWDDESLNAIGVDECHLATQVIWFFRDNVVGTLNGYRPIDVHAEVVEAAGDHPVGVELLAIVSAFDSFVDSRESVLVTNDFSDIIFDLLFDALHETSSVVSSSGWYCQRNASLKIRGSSGR